MCKNAVVRLTFICLLAAGCQSELVLEQMRPLEAVPGIRLLDPRTAPFIITETETGLSVECTENTFITLADPCRVQRFPVHFQVPGHNYVLTTGIAVLGQLGKGKQYCVDLDSGDPCFGSVTGDIVLENELPILPVKPPQSHKSEPGFCFLPSLRIGAMTIHNLACRYEEQYWVVRGFARPARIMSSITIGLTGLQQFAYVLCDNAQQEVEFSPRGTSFEPEDWDGWSRYRMVIEPDEKHQPRLMVDIPIGGQVRHIMLDTGAASQLVVSSTVWETLSKTLNTGEPKAVQYPLWQFGRVPCQSVCVRELPMGNKTIKNAEAVVLPDGGPTGAHFAMVGMGCFENDIIVLDFRRGFLWVKDPKAAPK